MTLSCTVGIPNMRVPPFGFGMSTLRTGLGMYLPCLMWSQMLSPCFRKCSGNSSTVILSTPGAPLFIVKAQFTAKHALLDEEAKKRHCISKGGLQRKLWKTTLEVGASILNCHWLTVQERTLRELRNRPFYEKLNPAERYYLACLLTDTDNFFFDMLDGKTPLPKALPNCTSTVTNPTGLAFIARVRFWKNHKRVPHRSANRSCMLTNECYSIIYDKKRNKFLRIITNKPRRRLSIPISPHVKISRTIELVRDSGKFYLHIPQQIKMKALQNIPKTSPSRQQRNRKTKYCVALDSGFTEVFVDDRGNFYGSDFGKITTATAIEIDEKIRKRNKLLSVLSKTSDCKKRHHILKYNLRTKKTICRGKKTQTTVENIY